MERAVAQCQSISHSETTLNTMCHIRHPPFERSSLASPAAASSQAGLLSEFVISAAAK